VKTWVLKMAYWLRRVRDRFSGESGEPMASKDRCDNDDQAVEEVTSTVPDAAHRSVLRCAIPRR
jgi:hypothetical protein